VDSGGALAVDAQALSGYEFSWLWNLVTPWLEDATYTTRETDADGVTVFSGDTVEVLSGHEGGGTVGSWYEYIGIEPYDVGPSEDFSDEAVWSSINPTLRKAGNFGTTLVPYLTGDFGFSFNIANTWTRPRPRARQWPWPAPRRSSGCTTRPRPSSEAGRRSTGTSPSGRVGMWRSRP
jgi:hypothetical protein